MPIYNNDPSKVVATFEVLPKDDYEMIVGEPKAFFKPGSDGKADNYGVRFPVTVASGPMEGKKGQPVNCYQHTDGAQQYSKGFQMAAAGFGKGRAEEQRFDAEAAGKDWSFDTDSGQCGDAWREFTGKRVIAIYDIELNKDTGEQQQKVVGYRKL